MIEERKTTTSDALLGMLTMGATSGYELKQRIERSIGNFWSESYGQIYPTLKRLEREGLVEAAPVSQGRAGSKSKSKSGQGQGRGRNGEEDLFDHGGGAGVLWGSGWRWLRDIAGRGMNCC